MSDPVNNPAHYKAGGLEAIDVIEAFELGFRLGNAVKYILRAGRKLDALEDLKKARWYLDREIGKRASAAPLEPPPPKAPVNPLYWECKTCGAEFFATDPGVGADGSCAACGKRNATFIGHETPASADDVIDLTGTLRR